MIIFVIICLLVAYSSICNARMDVVDDRWSVSVYKAQGKPYQWFNSTLSWTNKNNPEEWRIYAEKYLPKWILWLAKIKPAWSPLSDFWHWEKAKMIVARTFAISIGFAFGLDYSLSYPWGYVVVCATAALLGTISNLTFTYWYNRKLIVFPHKRKWLWIKANSTLL